MSLLTAEYRLVRAGGLAAAGLACWYWLRPGGGLGRALIRGSGWVLRRWLGLPAMGAAAEAGTSDLLRLGEHERDLLHMLNASFDLVTIVEVRDNTARRVYSSQSHKTLLGQELDLPQPWAQQGFTFRSTGLLCGLTQHEGGACGVLAAVQAFVVRSHALTQALDVQALDVLTQKSTRRRSAYCNMHSMCPAIDMLTLELDMLGRGSGALPRSRRSPCRRPTCGRWRSWSCARLVGGGLLFGYGAIRPAGGAGCLSPCRLALIFCMLHSSGTCLMPFL